MTTVPSVKGSVFAIPVRGVNALLHAGTLSQEGLELRLEPGDVDYLEQKILPAGWYPVDVFDRLAAVSVGLLAGGDSDGFFVAQGVAAAEQLLESQTYRAFAEVADARGREAGPSMLTMAQLIFNFSRWELSSQSTDFLHFEIDVREAAAMPDSLRFAAQGFVKSVAERLVQRPLAVESARPAPDRIVYRGRPA